VPFSPPPMGLLKANGPLIVGLTVDPTRLARVRSARLRSWDNEDSQYNDFNALRKEVQDARRLFVARNWPVIDVTHRSIEQVSAMIIDLLRARASDAPI